MEYADFTIRITSGSDDSYKVLVNSPVGRGESSFVPPFRLGDLADVLAGVADTVRGETRALTPTPDGVDRPLDAREMGVQLYNALFQGRVLTMLDQSLGSLLGRDGHGLRIRLQTDLTVEGAAEVASLPWELMSPDPTSAPLSVSKQLTLVRDLDVIQPQDPLPLRGNLRILAIMSNPKGTAPLDLEAEKKRIETSWAKLPGVEVDFVRPVKRDLLDALSQYDYHVVHYMGHGDFDAANGRGVLLFENEDGSPHPMDGGELEVIIKDENTLRLVFMNACKTGAASDKPSLDPFAGIATTLIKAGVPAVVAMQFPITDDAARDFADTFYRRIAEGLPVDAAVGEARKFLWPSLESITPVLFMRSPDGVIFVPDTAKKHVDPAPPPPRPDPVTPDPIPARPDPVPHKSKPWGKIVGAVAGTGAVAAAAIVLWPSAGRTIDQITWDRPSATVAVRETADVTFTAMADSEPIDWNIADVEDAFVLEASEPGIVQLASAGPGLFTLSGIREGETQITVRLVSPSDSSPIVRQDGTPIESARATITVITSAELENEGRAAADVATTLLGDSTATDAQVQAALEQIVTDYGGALATRGWFTDQVTVPLERMTALVGLGEAALAAAASDTLLAIQKQNVLSEYHVSNQDVRNGVGPTFVAVDEQLETVNDGLRSGGTINTAEGPLATCASVSGLACSNSAVSFPSGPVMFSLRASSSGRYTLSFLRDGELVTSRDQQIQGRFYTAVPESDTPGAWEIRVYNSANLLVGRHRFTIGG